MKNGVLTLFVVLLLCSQIPAQQKKVAAGRGPDDSGLVVRGTVTDLEIEKVKNYVRLHVKLNVEFVNEGTRPVILFRPAVDNRFSLENRYWLGGWSLALTEEDARNWKTVFGDGYWESVIGSDHYRDLAEKLDAKTPPEDYTKILQPDESWVFTDEFRISFEAEKHNRIPEHRTWKEMQEFPPQLWLRIHYELSPWNVEYFRPGLIRRLKERWGGFGDVPVEKKKEGSYNHFVIASEPMFVDFSQAKVKQSTASSGEK